VPSVSRLITSNCGTISTPGKSASVNRPQKLRDREYEMERLKGEVWRTVWGLVFLSFSR
jgi:hypothetical protein